MSSNITAHNYHISREDRNRKKKHGSCVIWFTGLSGSGKSTIANQLEKKLFEKGFHTYSLDGDNIRNGVNKDLSFSLKDRHENNRRVAEIARLMIDAGLVTVSAFISPLRRDREKARQIIGGKNFLEIYVDTPLEVCEARDVKGLYKKARAGEIPNFTGISAPYEPPKDPNIRINTENVSVEEAVERIYNYLYDKIKM